MDDLISRQAAIEALMKRDKELRNINWYDKPYAEARCGGIDEALDIVNALPAVHPGCDEWCTDCKEYDQEKRSCPRWNRVIKQTVEDVRKEIPDTTLILAEMLDGSPLLHPCGVLWHAEGWCKEHCKTKRWPQEPDTECWLRYAEVMAAKMEEGE